MAHLLGPERSTIETKLPKRPASRLLSGVAIGVATLVVTLLVGFDRFVVVPVALTMVVLGVLAVVDQETGLLPNQLVVPYGLAAWSLVLVAAVLSGETRRLLVALGISAFYIGLLTAAWMVGHVGGGDLKLFAGVIIVVAWLGVLPVGIWMVASWLPTAILKILQMVKRQEPSPIRQGPLFAFGYLVALLVFFIPI